jgi:hypothetical protein
MSVTPPPAHASTSNLLEIANHAKANASASQTKTTGGEKYRRPQNHTQVNTEEHQARQLQMLTSFADNLVALTNEASIVAAQKGYGWTKVVEYYLPGFDKVETDGEIQTIPRHSAEFTHWAGIGVNPTKDAVPIVMLLQGVRERTKTGYILRPDLLSGGKTSLQIAQEKLSAVNLDCSFNVKKKSLIITAIWNHAEWDAFLMRRHPRLQTPRARDTNPRERYSAPSDRSS